jgi:hypothetical protein
MSSNAPPEFPPPAIQTDVICIEPNIVLSISFAPSAENLSAAEAALARALFDALATELPFADWGE